MVSPAFGCGTALFRSLRARRRFVYSSGHRADELSVCEWLPAVRLHRPPIFEDGFGLRIVRGFQEVFELIDREVQVVIVHVSTVNMNLPHEVLAYLRPVFLEVVPEIVAVIAHVEGDLSIDLARQSIPDRAGIAVLADRAVRGVPGGDLFPGPHVTSQDGFEL